MNQFNQEYYLPFAPNDATKIFIAETEKTAFRTHHFKKLNITEGPYIFENAYKEENRKSGTKTPLPDIYNKLGWMIIPKNFMEFLRYFEIPGLQLFPAVYIDDDDIWHEDLWLVNFYEGLACLDVENSEIDNDPDFWEEGDDNIVEKPSLSEDILSKIPLEKRLIFKMSEVDDNYIYCHQRIVDFVRESNYTGLSFIKVADFREGVQRR